jgi:cleavage and polyadenylation specificity factor subunit 1
MLSAKTRTIIQSLELEQYDLVTSLKVMRIEVSEQTHEQKQMIVVATAAMRGEDMPSKGTLTVFDILDVVPDPEKPESGILMKCISREETKGAITALEAWPGGLIGMAQGMKVMIRGLKEDGSCLPVAFLDAQCYIASLKTLGRTGMWLAGDAWKGLWLGGWTEEPYRLTVMGKSRPKLQVVDAEFLPFAGSLFVVVVDEECNLTVLEYDPENPKSMGGRSLLRRGEFHLGHGVRSMALLPGTLMSAEQQQKELNGNGDTGHHGTSKAPDLYHVLTASASGAIGLLTSLEEGSYRRLFALQAFLANTLEHAAGLNPRACRAVGPDAAAEGGARGIVDGSLLRRVAELGLTRRSDALARAGMDPWQLRSDLEILGGGGLGYL